MDTYIHEKGVLGGDGILHGNVNNRAGLLFVGNSLFFKNWGNDTNNIPQTKTKNMLEIMGGYDAEGDSKILIHIDAKKSAKSPYLKISGSVTGRSALEITNLEDPKVLKRLTKDQGLYLIHVEGAAELGAFHMPPSEIGPHYYFLQPISQDSYRVWALSGQPGTATASLVPSDALTAVATVRLPERTSISQASPPAKPPRMLEYIELVSPLTPVEESVIEGHEYSEPQFPAEMLRPSPSSALTPAGESQSFPMFDDNTEREKPPLPARNGMPKGADRESLADQDDGRSAEPTPSRRDSRSGSFASANHYTPIVDRPAEPTSARRDSAAKSNVSVTPTVNRQRDDAVELDAAPITVVPPEVMAKSVATPSYPDKTKVVLTGKDNGDTPSHSGDKNDSGDLRPAGNGINHPPLTHDNGGNDNDHAGQADNESDNVSHAEGRNASGNDSQVEDRNASGNVSQVEDRNASDNVSQVEDRNASGNDSQAEDRNASGNDSQAEGRNASGYVSQAEDGNASGNVGQPEEGNDSGHSYQASGEDDNGSLPSADGENESVTAHAGGHVMGDELDEEDGREDGSLMGAPPFAPPTVIVPAVGVYAANHAVANTLFISRGAERNVTAGMTGFSVMMNGEPRPTLWLRILGGETHANVGNGSLRTKTTRQVVQGGGAIWQYSHTGRDSGQLGIMFGAGKSATVSHSTQVLSRASGGLQGYSVGLYAGWQQRPAREGGYLDAQLSYSWFNNHVQRAEAPVESYRSAGFGATLESGYRWRLFAGAGFDAFIEPQGQLSWMGVKANRLSARAAYRDVVLTPAAWQTRLGTRLSLCGGADQPGSSPAFQPYLEVNWITTSQPFGVQTGPMRYVQDGRRQLTEVKVGHEGQLSPRVGVWGHLAHQRGAGGFSDIAGSLGVKVNF
ncbi:autotransporter outer membrane beta-barrel domain-containing protein [Sodalis praecaptivus]|uniref:autotransporter outer membrane beta-barrel domain-containing protein n=1 Tax=Sodalis TaxID=84565 RepID=UPI00130E8D06|nr:autotransporter outer membrane beta-barrel domain-containing protein [Sodalis praecaptivus]